MNIVKRALAIAAMLLASFSALGTTIGGVTWDPDYIFDFEGVSASAYQQLDLGTGELSGYGRVFSLNGEADFCNIGGIACELTFQFDSYYLAPSETTPFVGVDFFTGGSVKFYVDETPDAPIANKALLTKDNTGDGDIGFGAENDLWLELSGHVLDDDGGVDGEGITFWGLNPDLFGSAIGGGALDVVGGLAAGEIIPNTQENTWNLDPDGPITTYSDFTFGSTFSKFHVDLTGGTDGMPLGTSVGGLTFAADTIPEPSTLGIFGLGLIALAFRVHNKRT